MQRSEVIGRSVIGASLVGFVISAASGLYLTRQDAFSSLRSSPGFVKLEEVQAELCGLGITSERQSHHDFLGEYVRDERFAVFPENYSKYQELLSERDRLEAEHPELRREVERCVNRSDRYSGVASVALALFGGLTLFTMISSPLWRCNYREKENNPMSKGLNERRGGNTNERGN